MNCNIFEEFSNPLYERLTAIESILKELLQTTNPTCSNSILNSSEIQSLLETASESHKGGFFYGQGENIASPNFQATGLANSDGQSFTTQTLYSWGSLGKFLTLLVLTKMMEEGLITSNTTLNSIDPNLYSGTGSYFTSINVTNQSTFPFTPSSYTYSTSTFEWSTLTIGDLLRFNFGLANDIFFLPALNLVYFDPASRAAILTESSVQGLGMMIQFGISYSALVAGNPITPGCQIYNGASYRDIAPIAVETYVNLVKNNVLPLLYNTNSYQNDLLPFRIRSLPATYDLSYALLGDVINKVLQKSGYENFSQYTREKIFNPLNMKNSYIIFQDTIPPEVLSKNGLTENSWRRAPAYGLTQPVNPANPATWLGKGCSPQYAINAGLPTPTNYGPLVWNSEYSNDGISYLSSFLYCTTKIPNCGPIGNAPLLSSIEDMGKLLQCILNQGTYIDCKSKTTKSIINKTSWAYFIANKTLPSTVVSGLPYPLESLTANSVSTDSALSHQNRDFAFNTLYGFDDSTLYKDGVTGCSLYFNFTTKVWMIYGFPEILSSSGYISYFSANYTGLPLRSLFIQALNAQQKKD